MKPLSKEARELLNRAPFKHSEIGVVYGEEGVAITPRVEQVAELLNHFAGLPDVWRVEHKIMPQTYYTDSYAIASADVSGIKGSRATHLNTGDVLEERG